MLELIVSASMYDNRITRSAIACALAISAVTSLAQGRSVSATLRPPIGWRSKPLGLTTRGFTVLGTWTPQSASIERISLASSPLPHNLESSELGDSKSIAQSMRQLDSSLAGAFGRTSIVAEHETPLCYGRQKGWYVESDVTLAGIPIVSESVYIAQGKMLFSAVYVRSKSSPADPGARRSLSTLCVSS